MSRSNRRWPLTILVAGALALSPACGPTAPAEPAGTSTGETPPPATTDTTDTTDIPNPTTTSAETTRESSSTSSTTTFESSSSTTEPLECIADPAQGICSEGCDVGFDCCQCDGKKLTPADVSTCEIPMGIVVASCGWGVTGVYWDGEPHGFEWGQQVVDGDVVLEFVGQTCTDYLAGDFTEIYVEVYCEAA